MTAHFLAFVHAKDLPMYGYQSFWRSYLRESSLDCSYLMG